MAAEIKHGLPYLFINGQYGDTVEAVLEPVTGDVHLTVENEEGFATVFIKPKDALALANFILGRVSN